MVVPYSLDPLDRAMVPYDVAVPSVDAFLAHCHNLAEALDFDFHRILLYVANAVSNDLTALVNCLEAAAAEYFSLAHDSYHFVGLEVPNFVDMVEIENVELHDLALDDRDIDLDQ